MSVRSRLADLEERVYDLENGELANSPEMTNITSTDGSVKITTNGTTKNLSVRAVHAASTSKSADLDTETLYLRDLQYTGDRGVRANSDGLTMYGAMTRLLNGAALTGKTSFQLISCQDLGNGFTISDGKINVEAGGGGSTELPTNPVFTTVSITNQLLLNSSSISMGGKTITGFGSYTSSWTNWDDSHFATAGQIKAAIQANQSTGGGSSGGSSELPTNPVFNTVSVNGDVSRLMNSTALSALTSTQLIACKDLGTGFAISNGKINVQSTVTDPTFNSLILSHGKTGLKIQMPGDPASSSSTCEFDYLYNWQTDSRPFLSYNGGANKLIFDATTVTLCGKDITGWATNTPLANWNDSHLATAGQIATRLQAMIDAIPAYQLPENVLTELPADPLFNTVSVNGTVSRLMNSTALSALTSNQVISCKDLGTGFTFSNGKINVPTFTTDPMFENVTFGVPAGLTGMKIQVANYICDFLYLYDYKTNSRSFLTYEGLSNKLILNASTLTLFDKNITGWATNTPLANWDDSHLATAGEIATRIQAKIDAIPSYQLPSDVTLETVTINDALTLDDKTVTGFSTSSTYSTWDDSHLVTASQIKAAIQANAYVLPGDVSIDNLTVSDSLTFQDKEILYFVTYNNADGATDASKFLNWDDNALVTAQELKKAFINERSAPADPANQNLANALGGIQPENKIGNVDVSEFFDCELSLTENTGIRSFTLTLPYNVDDYRNIRYELVFAEGIVRVKYGFSTDEGYDCWMTELDPVIGNATVGLARTNSITIMAWPSTAYTGMPTVKILSTGITTARLNDLETKIAALMAFVNFPTEPDPGDDGGDTPDVPDAA